MLCEQDIAPWVVGRYHKAVIHTHVLLFVAGRLEGKDMVAYEMSNDHVPAMPSEAARILAAGVSSSALATVLPEPRCDQQIWPMLAAHGLPPQCPCGAFKLTELAVVGRPSQTDIVLQAVPHHQHPDSRQL